MLLTDNIKMDTTIPTKIKWKIHVLYCFTLYFKFILKLLFIKICKIQPPDLLFVVFISIYSGRYNFSQTFRTSFSISYLKKRFLHMLQLCPFERLPSSRFFQKSPVFRACLHETRSELKPVWNLKPLWKVVSFTWWFHCGSVQMIAFN